MQRHFVQEIESLKSNLIRMGSFAEQAIADSIRALLERDGEVARRVIEQDKQVDLYEILTFLLLRSLWISRLYKILHV